MQPIKTGLFLTVQKCAELILNKMLTIVTNKNKIRQLFEFTCFYIHVDSKCMEEVFHA